MMNWFADEGKGKFRNSKTGHKMKPKRGIPTGIAREGEDNGEEGREEARVSGKQAVGWSGT